MHSQTISLSSDAHCFSFFFTRLLSALEHSPHEPSTIKVRALNLPIGTYGLHIHTFGDMLSVLDASGGVSGQISTVVKGAAGVKDTDVLG